MPPWIWTIPFSYNQRQFLSLKEEVMGTYIGADESCVVVMHGMLGNTLVEVLLICKLCELGSARILRL